MSAVTDMLTAAVAAQSAGLLAVALRTRRVTAHRTSSVAAPDLPSQGQAVRPHRIPLADGQHRWVGGDAPSPVAIVLLRPGCGPCRDRAKELARMVQRHQVDVDDVVCVIYGDRTELAGFSADTRTTGLRWALRSELELDYGIERTPVGLAFDSEGVVLACRQLLSVRDLGAVAYSARAARLQARDSLFPQSTEPLVTEESHVHQQH